MISRSNSSNNLIDDKHENLNTHSYVNLRKRSYQILHLKERETIRKYYILKMDRSI